MLMQWFVDYHRPPPQREDNVFSPRLCLFGGRPPVIPGVAERLPGTQDQRPHHSGVPDIRWREFRDDSYLFVSFSSMRRLRRSVSSPVPSSSGWNSP